MNEINDSYNVTSGLSPADAAEELLPESMISQQKRILRLENLISGLSTSLIDTYEENLESELNNWLRQFVEFLEVDRGVINKYLDNKTVQVMTYYTAQDVDAAPLERIYSTPEGEIEEFQKGIIISAENIPDDLPKRLYGGLIERNNSKSLIIVPLSIRGRVIGSLSFVSYRKNRKWPENLIRRIKLIGEIMANTIQRITAQQALSEEVNRRQVLEERYSSIIKNANVGFWILDQNRNIMEVNDEYCRMSGYSRGELLSMNVSNIDVFPGSARPVKIEASLQSAGAIHYETTHKRKDGGFLDLDVSSTRERNGKLLYCFMRDITELNQRKKAQEERLGFEELVSDFSAALININLDDLIEELRKWVIKFVEYLEIGRGVINEYQYDRNTIKALVRYTDPAEEPYTSPHDIDLKAPDGVLNEFKKGRIIRAEKIPDDLQPPFRGWIIESHNTKSLVVVPLISGYQVIGNLTFASYRKERKWSDDIFRRIKLIGEIIANAVLRKRASDALLEESKQRRIVEERYSQIIKTANVGFWVLDLNGRILEINDAYCEMSGYSRDELLGKTVEHIEGSRDRAKLEMEKNIVLDEGAYHHETSHIRKDGTLIDVAVNSKLIKEERVIFSFTRDITELNQARKKLEERLEFERLISGFSTDFINIRPDELDSKLGAWTKRFVEFLNVDRGIVNEYRYESNSIEVFVDYIVPGVEAVRIEKKHAVSEKIMKELAKGNVIRAEKIPEDLPPAFRGGRIKQDNSRSLILVPIVTGDQVIGDLVFVSYREERKWSDELLRRIKLIGEIVANAILRIRSHQALVEEMERRQRLEERYSSILETAKVGFWITRDQKIQFVNDEYCRMSGYSREELLNMEVHQIDVSGDPGKVDRDEQKTRHLGIHNHESRHLRKDGSIIDVEINSNFLEKEGVYFSFTRDVTDLKQTRRELEERLNLETLISEFSAALINVKLSDIKTEIRQWLERFAKILNVDRFTISEYQDDFSRINLLFSYTNPDIEMKTYPLHSEPIETCGFYNYLKKGESIKFEHPNETFPEDIKNGIASIAKNGTKSFLLMPLRVGDILLGTISIATIAHEKKWTAELVRMFGLVAEIFANALMRDKANYELEDYRKRLEEMVEERTDKLEKAQKELVISEKMATLGRLTATVSHELRNPLGTIRTSIYSLKKRLKDQNAKVVNALDRAERNIIRCDLIIEDLLNYSRTRDLNLKPTVIDRWIDEILGEMNPPDGITVERELNSGTTIRVDRERFRRCIVNILTNAYQAIKEKNGDENGCVSVRTYRDRNRVIIDISDNGIGFDMENVKKFYEPLYSTKTFGIGLGIPITLQIINQHGWGMEITGAPREGASVKIKIPVVLE